MRNMILILWRIWAILYDHFSRLQHVDEENNHLFRMVIKRYHGVPLMTSDGVVPEKGDGYVKLHLHNDTKREMGIILTALNGIRYSLLALVDDLARRSWSKELQILMGITFYCRGAVKLRFDVHTLADPFKRWFKGLLFKIILMSCHPRGFNRLSNLIMQLKPDQVSILIGRLFERYQVGI